ncbi:FKBP-type peptidyl-prolyl cis-trans isomerase [Olivibacter sitiensis]|uniref:FKBP-type peptidyl-prolyl cis-trans isomerase n=1 Tax=Olivibacter sitiensis TaxID=376470 RepID=UPI000425B6A5|nr:FKBP-type peptidyl-prolyl cis-trans isomerase [Olivibacter sitiensis]
MRLLRKTKYSYLFFIGALFIASCMKDEQPTYDPELQKQQEAPIIAAYVEESEQMQGAQYDEETGIWYVLESTGSGNYPYEQYPNVTVHYRGELLDGTVFDESEDDKPLDGNLYYLIDAWKIAFIPKAKIAFGLFQNGLQKGAKIKLVTPSVYAYRNQSNAVIPANSPLFFSIEVLDVYDSGTITP